MRHILSEKHFPTKIQLLLLNRNTINKFKKSGIFPRKNYVFTKSCERQLNIIFYQKNVSVNFNYC